MMELGTQTHTHGISKESMTNLAPVTPFKPKPETVLFEVKFPPGSMGLELEPVLISSERKIGCRVRDFYFEIDHKGISPAELSAQVSIGDILYIVEGQNVLSAVFEDILDLLRERKSSWRTVTFKNITTAGRATDFRYKPVKTAESHFDAKENHKEALSPIKLQPQSATKKRMALSPRNPNASNVLQDNSKAETALSKSSSPSANKQTPSKTPSNNGGFGRFVEKVLTPSKSDKENLPQASVESFLLSAKKRKQGNNESNFVILEDSKIDTPGKKVEFSDKVDALILSPQAVKQLSARKASQPTAAQIANEIAVISRESNPLEQNEESEAQSTSRRSRRNRSLLPTIPPEVMRILGHLGETIGAGIMEVGKDVGVGATNAVITVGSAVGDQAEKLVDKASHSLPRYSEEEVRNIMDKKNTLLNELAQASLLLGISQEKQQSLENESTRLRHIEEKLSDKIVQQENQIFSMQHEIDQIRRDAQTQKNQCEVIIKESQEEIEEWKRLSSEHKDRCSRLIVQLENSEKTIVATRDELNRERAMFSRAQESWESQLERITSDQKSVRADMESMVSSLVNKLRVAEAANEELNRKLREFQEQRSKDQITFTNECERLKENISSQQAWHQERMSEKEAELNSINNNLIESKDQLHCKEMIISSKDKEIEEISESLTQALAEVETFRSLHLADESKLSESSDLAAFYKSQLRMSEERENASKVREQKLVLENEQYQNKMQEIKSHYAQIEIDLKQQVAKGDHQHLQLQAILTQYQSRCESQISELSEKLHNTESTCKSLSSQVNEFQTTTKTLESDLESKTLELSSSAKKFEEISAKFSDLQNELICKTTENLQLLEQNESQNKLLQEMRIKMEEIASAASYDSRLVEQLNLELQLKSDSLSAEQNKCTEGIKMIEQLTQELESTKSRELAASQQYKLEKKQKEYQSAEERRAFGLQLSKLKSISDSVKEDHSEMRSAYDQVQNQFKILFKAAIQSTEAFQQVSAANQNENEHLKSMVMEIQLKLDRAYERAKNAEENTIHAENRSVEALATSATLTQIVTQLTQEKEINLNEIEALRNQVELFSNEKANVEIKLKQEKLEIFQLESNLKEELQLKCVEMSQLQSEVLVLQMQVDELNEQIRVLQQEKLDISSENLTNKTELLAQIELLHESQMKSQEIQLFESKTKEEQHALLISNYEMKIENILEEHRIDRLRVLATAEGRVLEVRRSFEEKLEHLRSELDQKQLQFGNSQEEFQIQIASKTKEFDKMLDIEKQKYNSSLAAVKHDLQQAKSEVDRIRNMENTFLLKLQEQDRAAIALQQQIDDLEAQHRLITEEKSALQLSLQVSENEIVNLKDQLNTLGVSLKDFEQKIVEEQLKNHQHEVHMKSLLSTNQDLNDQLLLLQAELLSKSKDVTVSADKETETDLELESQKRTEELLNDFNILSASLAAIKLENTILKNNLEEQTYLQSQTKIQFEKELNETLTEFQQIQEELKEIKENHQNDKKNFHATNISNQKLLNESEQQKLALESKLKELSHKVHTLEDQLLNKEVHLHNSTGQLNEKTQLLEQLQLASSNLMGERDKLQTELNKTGELLSNIKEDQVRTECELNGLRESFKRMEIKFNDKEQQFIALQRQLESAQAELVGGKQAVDKLLELSALQIVLQNQLKVLESKLEVTENDLTNEKLTKQASEQKFNDQIKLLEGKLFLISDENENQIAYLKKLFEDEKANYEIVNKEKETLSKAIREIQLDVISATDSALAWKTDYQQQLQIANELKENNESLKIQLERKEAELKSIRISLTESNIQLETQIKEKCLIAKHFEELKSELEKTRLREGEIMAVINLQTKALEEAEKREREYHYHRNILATSESKSREIASISIANEEKLRKRAVEFESQLNSVKKALMEKDTKINVLKEDLEKRSKELIELTVQLEKLLNGQLSPEKVAKELQISYTPTKSFEAAEIDHLKETCLQWHNEVIGYILTLHEMIVSTIRNSALPAKSGIDYSLNCSVALPAELISLSDSFDLLQSLVLHFPLSIGNEPIPTLPPPHLIVQEYLSKQILNKIKSADGTVALKTEDFVATQKIEKEKENERPTDRLNTIEIASRMNRIEKKLFADYSEPLSNTKSSNLVQRKPVNFPIAGEVAEIIGSSVGQQEDARNDSDFWELSSDGEEIEAQLLLGQSLI